MNKVAYIMPSKTRGKVFAPPSKSFSHRALICAFLAGLNCEIFPISFSQDVLATLNALKKMGAKIENKKSKAIFKNVNVTEEEIEINCFDSGSTLRFLIPLVAALGIKTTFCCNESLFKRPISEYLNTLSKFGIKFEFLSGFKIKISGKLKSGNFFIPGNISSQYISGLLMALPVLKNESKIILNSKLESSGYVDMTISTMKRFGVKVEKNEKGFLIKGNQKYTPCKYIIEGDWSQASYFLALGAINGKIRVGNLNKNSVQKDKQIFDILKKFGAKIFWNKNEIVVRKSNLKSIDIDASDIPDIVPVIAVLGSNAIGVTKIKNIKRLKFKECNRIQAICEELKKIGVNIKSGEDYIEIIGKSLCKNRFVWSHNDHRIAMMLALMGANLPINIEIEDAQSVEKSYPNFFEDYNLVGGKAHVVDVGE